MSFSHFVEIVNLSTSSDRCLVDANNDASSLVTSYPHANEH